MLREERGELGLVHEIEAGKTSLFLYAIRLSSKDKKIVHRRHPRSADFY